MENLFIFVFKYTIRSICIHKSMNNTKKYSKNREKEEINLKSVLDKAIGLCYNLAR